MHKVIPFNRPAIAGNEILFIQQVLESGHLCGNGKFTKQCQTWLEANTDCKKAFLTTSCTAALEMSAILMELQPGDEVIMPSYTFVSTANAFVLRGAIPVFVDIRPDTLNLDESKIEAAITPKTKAIAPVHYAGVGCEMDAILAGDPLNSINFGWLKMLLRQSQPLIKASRLAVLGIWQHLAFMRQRISHRVKAVHYW